MTKARPPLGGDEVREGLAVEALPEAAGGGGQGRPGGGLWEWLSRTLLHPVPAAAYLLLLVAGLVFLRPGGERVEPTVLPSPLTLWAPDTYRGGSATTVDQVVLDLEGDTLFFELQTDLDEERLDDPATTLRIELVEGETVLWSEERAGERLGEYGAAYLLLPTATLRPGGEYRLRVLLERPGDPRDGEALLDQPLLVAAP